MSEKKTKPFTRRKFLKLSAGAATVAGAGLFYLEQKKSTPQADDGEHKIARPQPFSVITFPTHPKAST